MKSRNRIILLGLFVPLSIVIPLFIYWGRRRCPAAGDPLAYIFTHVKVKPGERFPACRLILGAFGGLIPCLPGHYRCGEVVSNLKLISSPGFFGDGILPAVVDSLPLGIDHHIRKGAAGVNGHQRPGYFRHTLLTSSKGYDCSCFIGAKTDCPSNNSEVQGYATQDVEIGLNIFDFFC